jgi:hypothetical protein
MTTADDYVNTVLGMMPPTMPQRRQIAAFEMLSKTRVVRAA